MTSEEYEEVKALINRNDEQFQQYYCPSSIMLAALRWFDNIWFCPTIRMCLQGGPRPDSVDDTWEDFSAEAKRELIADTLW